jgi:hypothetical protein
MVLKIYRKSTYRLAYGFFFFEISISGMYLGQGEACDVCIEEEEEVAHLHVAGEPLHHLLLLLPLRLQHTTGSQQVTWTFLYNIQWRKCFIYTKNMLLEIR